MGPRITISYCCRVTSCTGSLGSQDSLYRGQIQKLLQCCREPYQQIPLVITIYNDSEKVYFDLSTMYRFVVIEGKVKGQICGSTGVIQVNRIQFCWQWSQTARLVNTIQIQNILLSVACFGNMVMQ